MSEEKNLQEQLAEYAEQFKGNAPKEVQILMEEKNVELIQSGIASEARALGERAPDFELPNHKGERISLSNTLQGGPVVVSFYRGGWCPYCNLELRALQRRLKDFKAKGANLLAISPQIPDASMSTQEKNELEFEVLSDVGNSVAKKFGLVFTLAPELRPIYKQFGIDLSASNGDDSFELPVPATYVIDPTGTIKFSFVNADYRRRAEPEDIIEALSRVAN